MLATLPLWRVRLARDVCRWALAALAAWGIAASARYAIDPPRGAARTSDVSAASVTDRAAEAFAVLFARRYLTWSGSEPLTSARELEPFVGTGIEPDVGLMLPSSGEQQVSWAEIAQSRQPVAGEHVYTVVADVEPGGLRYLTVPVARESDGALALAGYPAFVGPPATTPGHLEGGLEQVDDPALEVVVRRALSNYLDASATELAADLTPAAEVSLPPNPLRAIAVQHPYWVPGGGAVLATVQAEDDRGVRYTLGYELDVSASQGRWEISALQANPDAD